MVSFTAESTIHGVTFIFGPNRARVVRIFWSILFVASIYGLIYYIYGAFTKWMITPDIITKSTVRYTMEFPMPALTICPGIVGRSDMANFTEILSYNNKTTKYLSQYMQTRKWINVTIPGMNDEACAALYLGKISCPMNHLTKITSCNDDILARLKGDKTFFQLFDENSLNFDDINLEDTFDSFYINKTTKTKKVLVSPYGVCYSINLYSKDIFEAEKFKEMNEFYNEKDPSIEWSNDRGYFGNGSYPQPFEEDGLRIGSIGFNFNESDIENICGNKTMKLIFHPGNEIPTRFHETVDFGFSDDLDFELGVQSYRTSPDLKRVDANYRRCYFEDERKLKFFKKYSEVHCKLECFQEYMSTRGGTTSCDLSDLPIQKNSTKRICSHDTLASAMPHSFFMKHMFACNCLPNCNSIKYTYKIKRSNRPILAQPLISWNIGSPFVDQTERFSAYSLANFVSDIGGYLGLFLGCSMLSIVEILYFAKLQLLRGVRSLLKKNSSIVKKEIRIEDQVQDLEKLVSEIIKENRQTKEILIAMNQRLQRMERRFKVREQVEVIHLT